MIKKIYSKNNQSEGGFTLLDMTVIVIISGIILAALGSALVSFLKEHRVETTEYRIEKINGALGYYLSVHTRYPCPASRILALDDASYGEESSGDCNAGAVAGDGTVSSSGVRIGAVPTQTLNLSDEFMNDGWGRRFTFAMTEVLATPLGYRADAGLVVVQDAIGADINPNNDAHYILISHGRTGVGGFSIGASVKQIPCDTVTLDGPNCDDDAIFRQTLVNTSTVNSEFYDDYVYFQGIKLSHIATPIPTGAVMGFSVDECPDGWTNYLLAEGNFIIGAQSDTLVRNQRLVERKIPAETLDLDLSVMTTEFDISATYPDLAEGNVPPYLVLRYCEKLPS
jgi:type II secretory pathway pseudopilin PulG